MPAILRYGNDCSVRLESPEGGVMAQCGAPRGLPLDDPSAAVAASLAEPLDYPPLVRATTPEDRIVILLEDGVPRAAEVVAAVVHTLVEGGVSTDGLTVLQTRSEAAAGGDPRRLTPPAWQNDIGLVTHDPANRRDLAYLAARQSGEPILLSRVIHDADVVLPIGCLHPPSSAGYYGIHSSVYPAFSDEATIHRFRTPGALKRRAKDRERLAEEVEEVAWLLGLQFTIQVVPGCGDRVLDVLAGNPPSVARRGAEVYAQAWDCSVPRSAPLVVAAVPGGPTQQTWTNVGRALAAATALVEDDGAIVLCSELRETPGPALRRIGGARSRQMALKQIARSLPADALPAAQLADALERGHVYLLSRLSPEVVEQLDVTPLDRAEDLARLVRRFDSCIVLSNACHALVRLAEDGAAGTAQGS